MSIKVLPLRGYKSLRALNGFNALLLGFKMLPMYMGETYEKFYGQFAEKPDHEKEQMLREAAVFVALDEPEVKALVSFACDANGIPYDDKNMKNLDVKQLHEIIVAVCMEIGRMRVDILSDAEKKKLPMFSIDIREQYLKHPELDLQELINLAFYEAHEKCLLKS